MASLLSCGRPAGLTYARFMDDWLILALTRWSLRRAIRIVNETLRELRVEQHPDKTFIGRIKRGFTFLGYWITERGVTGVAPSAWEGFQERMVRLYEQDAPPEEARRRIEQYVRRWKRRVCSGAGEISRSFECADFSPGQCVFVPRMLPPAARLTEGSTRLAREPVLAVAGAEGCTAYRPRPRSRWVLKS